MENLLAEFQESLHTLGIAKNERLLLAVSGGLDSVVLTLLSTMSELDFAIAHANFQLRGAESERDETFVRQLADKYQKPLFVKKFDCNAYAKSEKLSIQVAARNLRYEWFKTFIGHGVDQYKFLLTGHHLDDNIETMVMHFFRGTGLSGLTGMPEKNGHLLRTLLKIPGKRLKEFALEQDLEWVEDSSNASDDYTRNFFRNQLIPSVTGIFPDVQINLKNNINRFSEANMLYEQAISLHKKRLLKQNGAEINIPILLLKKAIPLKTILYEIIKEYDFSPLQTGEMIRLMDSANGKYISSSSHRIIKNRGWLIIAPANNETPAHIVIDTECTIEYPEGRIHVSIKLLDGSENFVPPPGTECLDAKKIRFPLLLRKWKAGDYFYPLGMKKKKKLARFFIDQKLSKTAKEKIWVLVMDSQIVCVVGQRIDNRFRMDSSTEKILMVRNETIHIH
ncbi:MAG TPA: tRNA lysidine(34) synthetase TilS [Puia sp.]|nr:tRNA lysidine(34) synthetase TilS [Puia sp.]